MYSGLTMYINGAWPITLSETSGSLKGSARYEIGTSTVTDSSVNIDVDDCIFSTAYIG